MLVNGLGIEWEQAARWDSEGVACACYKRKLLHNKDKQPPSVATTSSAALVVPHLLPTISPSSAFDKNLAEMSFTGLRASRKTKEARSFVKPSTNSKAENSSEQSVVTEEQCGTEQANIAEASMSPSTHLSGKAHIEALEVRESTIAGRGTFATVVYEPGV